jgi:uncharacterized membrane-anchored protein
MLTAGTLGTAGGDYAADEWGLGLSSVVFIAILAGLLTIGGRATLRTKVRYWVTIVVVRTAGTNLGDFLAGGEGLHLGLVVSTACTGLVLVGTLVVWRPRYHATRQA